MTVCLPAVYPHCVQESVHAVKSIGRQVQSLIFGTLSAILVSFDMNDRV